MPWVLHPDLPDPSQNTSQTLWVQRSLALQPRVRAAGRGASRKARPKIVLLVALAAV